RWVALAAQARAARPDAEHAVRILRGIAPTKWRRSGYGLRWGFHVALPSQPAPLPEALMQQLRDGGRLGQIQRVVERHLELAACLAEIEAELAVPGSKPLSAPARAMLAAPEWPDYAWLLAEPGRLLTALGAREGI
ncbi:MAG: hypothetical protein JWM80_5640, partial [Cyanobacteria bacterium RYN_339]|nr:hypothetical protein [Cyanobacteria bacterium RYN_339]